MKKPTKKPVNFVSNKALLASIWESKLSYCDILDEDFLQPDVIVYDLKEVKDPDLTICLRTESHIPKAAVPGKGKLGHLDRISFPPFILYRSFHDDEGNLHFEETARSHHEHGWFEPERGRLTDTLAKQMMMMVDRYALKGSWRNYSYIDEMKSEALMSLLKNGLKFDEDQDMPNPFAYFTQIIHNAFLRHWNGEKRQQEIRDDLIEAAGSNPSLTRQMRSRP